jgi:hypothetical protein
MFSPFSNETVTQTFLSAKFPYMTWSAKCGRQNKWLSSCYKSTDIDSTSHFPKLGHVQHYFSLPCMHVFFRKACMHLRVTCMHLLSRICMRSVGVSLSSQWLNLMGHSLCRMNGLRFFILNRTTSKGGTDDFLT